MSIVRRALAICAVSIEVPMRLIGLAIVPLAVGKRIAKIQVRSVARLFADAIHAIHDGSSVSRLFR